MAKVTNINLLPWREDRRADRNRRFLGNCFFAVLMAGLMSWAMVWFWGSKIEHQNDRNAYVKSEIKDLDKVIAEINTLRDKKTAIVGRIDVIQRLQSNRTQIVHMFDDLVKKMPSGVYLDKVNKAGLSLAMSGKAQSNGRVSDLMRNLDSSDWFENASLNVVNLDDSDTVAVSQFDLKVVETLRKKTETDEGNL